MLLAGDELGQTQQGNNNSYCQDNELAWLNWDLTDEQEQLLHFVQRLIRFRKSEPVFRRRHFYFGRPIVGTEIKDLYWIRPASGEMTIDDWHAGQVRSLGMGLVGHQISETDAQGQPIVGDSFLLLFNAHHDPVEFHAGERMRDRKWEVVLETHRPEREPYRLADDAHHIVAARSVTILKLLPK
jgi:isoamylase